MAAVALDVDYLSAYLSVPQQTLDTVIESPTIELIRSVLAAVITKAREHDELAADKLRADIELENAVRSSETRIQGLRTSIEKAHKTVEEVRIKLKEEEDSRSTLETELQALKSTSSSSTSEVETLRARISSLEAANRDTIAVLETKTTANDNLAQDLQKQHQKGLELSQQITALQQSVQNATSAASSAKFREQSLKQEVDLAKRNNEWFENELKTKSAEALKHRKEKGARIAELQRLNEEANSNLEALKRTEQALRTRVDEVQKKAEESLSKVQQLQEAAAKTEDGFRQELESSRRLAELQSQQTETHRSRLREVEAALDKAKDEAADEVGRCRQEVEAERQDREQAEHRIAELEGEVDRLEAIISSNRQPSVPGTPRQGLNGSYLGRAGSPAPFGTPGSARSKSTVTATQAIEELYKVKGLLGAEKRRSERLSIEMDEMMQGLEAKQPEIEEMQAENSRLQQELVEMSKFVDQTGIERDSAKKDARKAQISASTAQAEANILRQQLRDLSAQIKLLLCDIDARERGLEALSTAERSNLERLAHGEVGEDTFEGLTDTDRFISQRLTVFRSVSELQEKNQELLKITRQLGAQMESEEALAAKHQAAKDHQEVQNLQVKIENYKDELQSVLTRSESYIKERDMFRRMLQHRGQLPPNSELASVFGQSVDGNQNGFSASTENGLDSRDNANYATLLRELQAHFDQYREEQSIDRRTMKEQTDKLSSEKSTLQAEIARVSSQLTLASERYEMLNSNYVMLQNENIELQKRSQILSEAAAKQDLRTQQVAEDLIDAKGVVESMRNENANLKAEKKLWKEIQDRLSQDNENLMNERTRLNNLVANQQILQNERELTDSENRRRLQSQVESLETELSATKRKLADETEDNKKAQLRKEYDSQQNQNRIDDLAASLSQAREELVAAKTTRDHLQSRVDELTIELKSAEERVELLQPRPTPRSNADMAAGSNEQQEESLSKEQELSIELSEVKRDLDLAKSELEGAKSQMEQYKAISQSSEEELQSLNATQDQYREEMDRILEEKDAKIQELQQRADDIAAELTNTNNELTTLRNQQGEVARLAEEEKATLETEIARLKEEDEKYSQSAQFHQQDLRAQAAIATKAQQDYENELVKHAEAAKLVQTLRADYNQLKTEAATFKAEAESAKVALSQSESSWDDRRERFELEVKELRTRRDDINAQNKLLHQQLENVGVQISTLQQSRASLGVSPEERPQSPEATIDRTADGLRELNSYLRREKEIIEVQYELKVQEAKRLQQQLEYTQSQLDDNRLKLDQERRQHADGGRSTGQHKDLLDKLNELNLFRESSITLRNEAREAQAQLVEKTRRVEELQAQIQPLETRIRELEHGKETTDGEMLLLQADRDRWQKRTQDIISKYDRIDPAEMEQLKETIETLRIERDSLLEEKQPLQDKLSGLETEKANWQQSRQKLIDQAKEKNRLNSITIRDRTTERDSAVHEKETLQQQLSGLQQELNTAVQEKQTAEQKVASLGQELEFVKSERDQALVATSQPPETNTHPIVEPQQTEEHDQQLTALRQERDEAIQAKSVVDSQLEDLRKQLESANSARDSAIADATTARSMQIIQPEDKAGSEQEEGQVDETPAPSLSAPNFSNEERKQLEDRIIVAEAKAKEYEEKATRLESDLESTLKQRSDKMKAALNKKLTESKELQKAELRVEFDADYKLRLEQEKKILAAELQSTNPLPAASAEPVKDLAVVVPPPTPATPTQATTPRGTDGTNLTDAQVRELLSSNPTIKKILASNLKSKLEVETQKIKDEQDKISAEKLADAQVKAESAKTQAVLLEGKKSTLRINMADNKAKLVAAKLEIVSKAAQETPQKPVVEVWELVVAYKPPAPVSATPEAATLSNGNASPAPKPAEVNTGPPKPVVLTQTTLLPATPQTVTNGTPGVPATNIPSAPPHLGNNNPRASGIPMARGGGNPIRGRGGPQMYQSVRGGGQPGRGRGGGMRGGLNAGAQPYNPHAQSGIKRPRDEGSNGGGQQGNGGKRPRPGEPNN